MRGIRWLDNDNDNTCDCQRILSTSTAKSTATYEYTLHRDYTYTNTLPIHSATRVNSIFAPPSPTQRSPTMFLLEALSLALITTLKLAALGLTFKWLARY